MARKRRSKRRNKPDLAEIRDRLDEQIYLAHYLQRAAMPNGETLYGAAPQFVVLATALGVHLGKLREIRAAL